MFPYAEFGLTSGTQNEVTGSVMLLIQFQMKVILVMTFFQGSLFLSDDWRNY